MRLAPSVLALSLTVAVAVPAAAQSGAYVVRLGTDTLAVEKFTRTANRIEGEMVSHVGRVTIRRYSFDFDRSLTPVKGEVTVLRPGAETGAPVQHMLATFQGDSVFSEITRDTATTRRRVGLTHGATILPGGPYGLYEIMLARALRGSDSTSYLAYGIGSPQPTPMSAWRLSRDSVAWATPWDVYHAKLDREGRIIGSIPQGGTQQWSIERVASLDTRAIATRWAATEKPDQTVLTLSPRDTVRATVGGAQLMIDYGRPTKRGRTIFGTVVPWGSTWRTGANAATQFRTDKALEMGGIVVPAGFYTLWSIPTPTGWQLVINGETGQWGTEHKDNRDLFHLPMQVGSTPRPVEQFTISVAPSGSGGTLVLEWDTTRATMPFAVR
ncbi:MAG TPA: DUF2911 domain-containing protein [Gemmatimonadales bacterium]|jgi:hypothetical protein